MQFPTRPPAFLPRSHRAAQAILLLFFAAALLTPLAHAQSAGDYRTRGSGKWSRKYSWQIYNGSTWVNANNSPDWSDGQITIRAGHTINGDGGDDYDQLVIEAGATLRISKSFTIVDGPGTDLQVFGEIIVNNDLSMQDSATAYFEPNSTLDINRGDTFEVSNTSSVVFSSSVTITSAGDFIIDDDASAVIGPGTTFTNENRGVIEVAGDGSLSFEGSTLINEDEVVTGNNGAISFDSNSIYEHAQDGSAFPPASSTTWDAGSTAIITDANRNLPAELDATFSNFIWDSPGQSRSIDLEGTLTSITGDLTVHSTGSGSLMFDAGGASVNIDGNYNQDGGDVQFLDDGTATMTVGGDFELSGGTFTMAVAAGSPTLEVGGDLLISGSFDNSGTGTTTISLSSSSTQIIDISGSLTGSIDLDLSGSGEKQLTSDLTLEGSLTESSGGLDLNGNILTLARELNEPPTVNPLRTIAMKADQPSSGKTATTSTSASGASSTGKPTHNSNPPTINRLFELLKKAAQEELQDDPSSESISDASSATALIPYYVQRQFVADSGNRAKLHGLLFVLCLLFLLVDIDLLVRYAVTRRENGIRSMKDPAWMATSRQLVVYLFTITVATVSWGMLAGISVSLALSGISVAVETRKTYSALWNIALLSARGMQVGTWIVWRKAAVHIQGVGIESINARTLDGQQIDIPTHIAHELIDRLYSINEVQSSDFTVEISRMADLSYVRSLLEETLRPLSPSGISSNVGIEFEDLDEHRTNVRISLLALPSHPDQMVASALCEKSLAAAGIPRPPSSENTPGRDSVCRDGKTYGPLRLVKGKRAA